MTTYFKRLLMGLKEVSSVALSQNGGVAALTLVVTVVNMSFQLQLAYIWGFSWCAHKVNDQTIRRVRSTHK